MTLPKIEDLVFKHLESLRAAEERAPSLLEGIPHANASSAGNCARLIGYRIAKAAESNPITGDSLFNFSMGDHVHDQIQAAFCAVIPECQIEVNGKIEDFITVRADLLYKTEEGKLVCGEIKSVSDFAYKLATGVKLKSNGQWNKKGQTGEGPKREYVLQNGISARALGADYLHVIYARKTAAKSEPIFAEFRFKIKDLDDKIDAEIARLKWIVDSIKKGILPAREYEDEIIENPAKKNYPCGYCSYLETCSQMPSEAIPLNSMPKVVPGHLNRKEKSWDLKDTTTQGKSSCI